ncbi:hypothetical protein, partial [Aerosakkonema funiforme]
RQLLQYICTTWVSDRIPASALTKVNTVSITFVRLLTCRYVAATQHSRASAMLDVCAKTCYSYKEVRV